MSSRSRDPYAIGRLFLIKRESHKQLVKDHLCVVNCACICFWYHQRPHLRLYPQLGRPMNTVLLHRQQSTSLKFDHFQLTLGLWSIRYQNRRKQHYELVVELLDQLTLVSIQHPRLWMWDPSSSYFRHMLCQLSWSENSVRYAGNNECYGSGSYRWYRPDVTATCISQR